MARFHGQVRGSRQPATRVGTPESGIHADLASGSRTTVETGASVAIVGDAPDKETVRMAASHRSRLIFNVEFNAQDVAEAMLYDQSVRFYLGVIEDAFRHLARAATDARRRRVELALRAASGNNT